MISSFEPEGVVVELVVAGQGDQAAEAGAQRVEDLRGSVSPHLGDAESV